jgi:hypothetical protein
MSSAQHSTNLVSLLNAFPVDDIAHYQARKALEDLSDLPMFTYFIVPYAQGTKTDLTGCTYRYVVDYLDSDNKLDELAHIKCHFDWFSSVARALEIKARKVSAIQYAKALAEHKTIAQAEEAVLA